MQTLVEHYSGSIAYGTNGSESDTDIRGIYIPSLNDKLIGKYSDTVSFEGEDDKVLFELSFFIKLAMNNNPTILETLFINPKHVLFKDPCFDKLVSERNNFLSKKVATSYLGYANQQIKRMNNHKVWIDNENSINKDLLSFVGLDNDSKLVNSSESDIEAIIKQKGLDRKLYSALVRPKHSEYVKVEFNFTKNKFDNFINNDLLSRLSSSIIGRKVGDDLIMCYSTDDSFKGKAFLINNEGNFNFTTSETATLSGIKDHIDTTNPDFILKFKRKEYELAMSVYEGFQRWKTLRNSKRLSMERSAGYDTKHMSHTIRLLKQGLEILQGKGLIVDRTGIDADYLKDVKAGKYSYGEVMDYAQRLIDSFDSAIKNSTLPELPLVDPDKLLLELYTATYGINEKTEVLQLNTSVANKKIISNKLN